MKRNNILVAMSGGVDSSVSAYLLKSKGFDVSGVFLKMFDGNGEAELRARRIAQFLKVPFSVVDCRQEFKKKIIGPFLEEYRKGNTPNPCVFCNEGIKFKTILRLTDFVIATGHYAKASKGKLLKAKCSEKDQSYFLWRLKEEDLKRIIFPLADLTKKEVIDIARKIKLPFYDKEKIEESQEICFAPEGGGAFLRKKIRTIPGKIVDDNGNGLGTHDGLAFYTIGQRKGLMLPNGPYFVIGKNLKKNILIVSKKTPSSKQLSVKSLSWVNGKPEFPLRIKARIRYRHKEEEAILYSSGKLVFKKPQTAITTGQSVVFFKKNRVLGGGVIK